MTVEDMIKSVVIASANDAAVALAEHIEGSESAFVKKMNEKAKSLGMTKTNFENTNGLDDTTVNHVISARDISIMSRELITKHEKILEYSSIWMDSIRGGEFGLTNTNRLIRFYNGANGLKTGSTSKAGFCISASAKRDGMQLICVVMAASTRDSRNEIAKKLFDFGFANYAYECFPAQTLDEIRVVGGVKDSVALSYEGFDFVTDKSNKGKTEIVFQLPETLSAPVAMGQTVGKVRYLMGDEVIGEFDITASEEIRRVGFWDQFLRLLGEFLY